jgi:hypothetical protein
MFSVIRCDRNCWSVQMAVPKSIKVIVLPCGVRCVQ